MDERGADDRGDEEELAGRQAPALYPIGRALRATFDAENHDSLGTEMTALMLNLARVEPPVIPVPASPFADAAIVPPAAPPTALPGPAGHGHAAGGSWFARVIGHLIPRPRG